MSKKLAIQALDALLSSQTSNVESKKTSSNNLRPSNKRALKSKKNAGDPLPKTKTGLKRIKRELKYGHSVKRAREEREAKENPLDRMKSQLTQEQAIVERNLEYYKTTTRVSKKEVELRSKIKELRAKAVGAQSRRTAVEKDESDDDE
ncbi:hypothetical protein EDD11_004854 [Mortierella claussenii]|nr:hypothetical protein EDD11_004854 [Mortierella claussenii]